MKDYLTPAFVGIMGGILVQLIAKLVDYVLQKRKIVITDEASLRKALMDERKNLVAEIKGIAKRCDALEKENSLLNDKIVNLKKEHLLETATRDRRIWELEGVVARLKQALSAYE